jgi:hypothetical protein
MGDLFKYSTHSKQWTQLDAAAGVTGTVPSARESPGMASVGTDFFVFGGISAAGDWRHTWARMGILGREWAFSRENRVCVHDGWLCIWARLLVLRQGASSTREGFATVVLLSF